MTTNVINILPQNIANLNLTPAQQLSLALQTIDNAAPGQNWVINLGTAGSPLTVSLTADLPIIAAGTGGTVTINGNGSTIDGGGAYRGLLDYSGTTAINNLAINNTVAHGGNGGNAANDGGTGGGGAGLGGGLFVADQASAVLNNVTFTNTKAIGGDGGSNNEATNVGLGGGGGGGMGGNGAASTVITGYGDAGAESGGGGGGGLGKGANGASGTTFNGYGYTPNDAAAGIAAGQASGGNGGSESEHLHLIVYNKSFNFPGSNGGADGGGGGLGFDTGGGGGGIGGQSVADYSIGSFGIDLTFSGTGYITGLLALADVIAPEVGIGLSVAYGLYTTVGTAIGSPGYVKTYTSFTLTGDPGFGVSGTSVPIPKSNGLGLSVSANSAGTGQPGGGVGGFGGGGGGGGSDSSGGDGGFGGGGGGITYRAGSSGYSDLYAGDGGFGGGAGGGSAYSRTHGFLGSIGGGTPGFGGGLSIAGLGGGGLGAGGAIFVEQGGQISYAGGSITNSSVAGGKSGFSDSNLEGDGYDPAYFDGAADGSGIFLEGQSKLALTPGAGQTVSVGNISDEAGSTDAQGNHPYAILVNGIAVFAGSVQIGGSGKTVLSGTNTYLGGTYLADDVTTSTTGSQPAGGSTVEITSGTTFYGTFYVQGDELASAAVAPATLVLDKGVTLANPLQILNDFAGNTGTVNGVQEQLNALPLIIDESAGGIFTGTLTGLQAGQHVAIIGAPFNTSVLEADSNGFSIYTQAYVEGNATTGKLAEESNLWSVGSNHFFVAAGNQLQSLLTWIAGNDTITGSHPTYASNTSFVISLDGQIGDTFNNANIIIPTLPGTQSIVFDNEGTTSDGQTDAQHAKVTVSGGSITLSPTTKFSLLGPLEIDSTIEGSAGSNGLSIAGAVTLGGNNTFLGGITFSGTLDLANANAAGAGTITFGSAGLTLKIDGTTMPANTIAGYAKGDIIDLTGISGVNGLYLSDASGNLTIAGKVLHLGAGDANTFILASTDGATGTDLKLIQAAAATPAESPTPVLTLLDGIAARAPAGLYSFAISGSTVTLTTLTGVITAQPGASDDITFSGTVDLPASIPAGIDAITFAPPGASGGQTLQIDGKTLPATTLTGFVSDDTIDLTGIPFTTAFYLSDASDNLTIGGKTLHFGADLAPNTLFFATSNGTGGTDLSPVGSLGATPAVSPTGVLALLNEIAAAVPKAQYTVAVNAGAITLTTPTATITAHPGTSADLTFSGRFDLPASIPAGIGKIDFAAPSGSVGQTLQIDGTTLPATTLTGFAAGDTIDLTGIALAAPLYLSDASDNLTIGGKTLHFGADLAPNTLFLAASDGTGGTDLSLLGSLGATPAVSPTGVLTLLNEIAAAVPKAQYTIAFNAGAVTLTTPTATITADPGISTDLTFSGLLDLPASIQAGIGKIVFAATTGGVAGQTFNTSAVGQTLEIDGTVLPTTVLSNFVHGDTIDLTGIQDYTPLRISGDDGTLVVGGQTLHFAADVPPDSFYLLSSDGQGGTDITSIGLSSEAATEDDLQNAIAYINGLSSSDFPNAQFRLSLDAPSGTITLTAPLPALNAQSGIQLLLDGEGETLSGDGSTQGIYLSGGQAALQNITLTGFTGPGVLIHSGTTATLDNVDDAEGVSIPYGGTLVLRSGSVGPLTGSGTVDVAPAAGQTATLTDAIPRALTVVIVDPNAQADLGATTQLGTVVFASGASANGTINIATASTLVLQAGSQVSGTLNLTSDSTVDLQSGASFDGTIDFDSRFGGTFEIDGTSLPANTIDMVVPYGEIALSSLAPSSPQILTLGSDDTLAVPGMTGVLHFSGDVVPGETFVLSTDANGLAALFPAVQSTTISSAADFALLAPLLDALPADDGLSIDIALSGNILLQASTPLLKLNAGNNVQFIDAPGTVGGLTLASGISASLDGTNTFSGGVTLSDGSTLQLYSMAAAGPAGVTFAGTGATLVLPGAGLSAPIVRFQPTDSIDLTGVTPPADSAVFVDAQNDLSVVSASGTVTLAMPDQISGSLFNATSDGHGGTLLTEASGREILTAGNAADFDNDIAVANASPVNTEIVLTYAADSQATLADALARVNLQPGEALAIQGITVQSGVPGATFIGTPGSGATLLLNAAHGAIAPIVGLQSTDRIDLQGVTPPAASTLYVSLDDHLTIPSASGAVTLSLPDLVPGSPVTATSDGHGGTLLDVVADHQTLTAHNEVELDQDIALAAAAALNTEIVLDFSASGNAITLTHALTAVDLQPGTALAIEGNGAIIDGAGAYGGFFAQNGHLDLFDMTIQNAIEQGGDGQSAIGPLGTVGAGGGAGLGGGVFVGSTANVGLYDVTLSGNAAAGGAGGNGQNQSTVGSLTSAPISYGGLGDATSGAPGTTGSGGDSRTDSLNVGNVPGFDGSGESGHITGVYPNYGGYGGGGGLGAGGNVFVAAGGQLTLGGAFSESAGSVLGGASGTPTGYAGNGGSQPGAALGSGIYASGPVSIALTPGLGQTQVYQDDIAGGVGLDIDGAGTVELEGTLTYGGLTQIDAGTLVITSDLSGLTGAVVDNAVLRLEESGSTTLHSLLSGTGALVDASAGTVTLAGGLSLSGGVEVLAGTLRIGGSALTGSIENDATLDIATSGTMTDTGAISGTGDVVYDGTGVTTLAADNTDSGALTVAGGKLVLSGANGFTSVVLNGGELALGAGATLATGTIAFAPGASSTLSLTTAAAGSYVLGGFMAGDIIHLADFADPDSVSVDGDTLTVVGQAATASVDVQLSADTDTTNALYNVVSDGQGGTYIESQRNAFQIGSEADLKAALAAIAPGGAAAAPGLFYEMTFTSGVSLDSALPPITLPAGASLLIDGAVSLSDPTASYTQSQGYQLTIASPGVTINTGQNPFNLSGVGLDVTVSSSLAILQQGGDIGANSLAGIEVDGSLTISGSLSFEPLVGNSGQPTHPALTGTGNVTLEGGTFTIGNNNESLSFAGTLALRSATLVVPGSDRNTTGLSLHELDLYGTSTATIDISKVQKIVFEPGATATLSDPDALPTFGGTIYGMAAGDKIIGNFGTAFTRLASGNVLEIASTNSNGGIDTYRYQLDPTQDLSGLAFEQSGNAIVAIQASYVVSTEAELDAAIKAIGIGQNPNGGGNHYTITLAADLTGADALTNNLATIALAAGKSGFSNPTTLTIDGDGHTIDGNGFGIFDSNTALTLNDITLENAGPGAFTGALDVTGGTTSLNDVTIAGGVNGSSFVATPAADQKDTISGSVTGGSFLLNGPGTLDLSGYNSFTGGITIDQGTLELGQAHSAGAGTAHNKFGTGSAVVTFAGDGTILADTGVPAIVMEGLSAGHGAIDLAGYTPAAISLVTGHLGGSSYTDVTASGDSGNLYLDAVTGPLVVFTDGAGGSLIYVTQTQLTATDGASLQAAFASFSAGGNEAAANVADTIALSPASGTIGLTSALPTIALPNATSLTVQGNGDTIDFAGQAGLTIAAGAVTLQNLTLTDIAAGASALTLGDGTSALLNAVTLNAVGGSTPLVSVGDDATLSIVDGTIGTGVVALQDGAVLALSSSNAATPLVVDASIRDSLGDGTGTDSGRVTIGGDVRLDAVSDFSGGVAVNGLLDLAAPNAAGSGTIAIAKGGTLAVENGVQVSNLITGLANGGLIDAKGIVVTSAGFTGNYLTVSGADGSLSLDLAEAGLVMQSYQDVLTLTSDDAGGTLIGFAPRALASVAVTPTTVAFGNVHVLASTLPTGTITVTNAAPAGGETIVGSLGALSAGLMSYGSTLSLASGQAGSLVIGTVSEPLGANDGVYSGTAMLALTSGGLLRPDAPLTLAPVTVTATYYNYAAPSAATAVDLGAARVGDAPLTGSLVISNGTTADPYQEGLDYSFSDLFDPALTATNASSTTPIVSGGNATIGLSLSTATGSVIDDVAVIRAASDGAGTSGLGDTDLGAQAVTITGTVYNKAVAQLPASLAYYAHVGSGFVTRILTIGNAGILQGATDDLVAGFDGAQGDPSTSYFYNGGAFEFQGGSLDIAAGSSGTFNLQMQTSTAGVFSTTATLDFASHDSALADLALPSQTVALTGNVYNYASAGLALQDGSAGTLTSTDATHYTLDFGDITSSETADLAVLNTATGLADVLSGYFTVTGGNANFQNAGIDYFSGITAGSADDAPAITITTGVGGDVSETLVLTPTGSDAGGYTGNLAPITLTVTGHFTTTSFTATSEADLDAYIALINQGGLDAKSGENYTITLAPPTGTTINVLADLQAINLDSDSSLDIVGNGTTLAGDGTARGLVVQSGGVTLDDVNFSGFTAPTNATDASGNGADVAVETGGSLSVVSGTFGAGTAGSSLSVESGSMLTFTPAAGASIEVAGGITSDATGAVNLAGAGTLELDAAGTYSGGTRVAGTLDLETMDAAGSGTISLQQGSTLQLDATGTLQPIVAGFAGATIDATAVQAGTVTLVGNQLTIANATTSVVVDLADSNLSYYGLAIGTDAEGGTTVTEAAPGFAPEVLATAGIGSVSFGNVHVGDVDAASFTITNTLLQGGDTLVATTVLPAPFSTSGSLSLAPGQSETLGLSFTPTDYGSFSGTLPLTLQSQNANGTQTPVTTYDVAVSGNVYALATPTVSQIGNLGAARLGGSLTGEITITNGAGSPYQESLAYDIKPYATGTTPDSALGDLVLAGGDAGVVPSGSATIGVTLTATHDGVDTFALPISMTSIGAGTSGLADTSLAQQQTYVTGTFYRAAVAQYTQSANFGWLHVGDIATAQTVSLSNVATPDSTYLDTLAASWNSIGDGFSGTGSVSGLSVGGATGSLSVGFTASTAGIFTDDAILNLASQDAVLADQDTLSGPIALTATVTNYAALSLQQLSGGGTFAGSGSTDGPGGHHGGYTLNLGDISSYSPQDFTFDILNSASGFADQVSGSVDSLGGAMPLSLSGTGLSFSGLSAGQSGSAFTIEIDPSQAGAFTDEVVIHGTTSNAGGYDGSLGDTYLTITGTVTTGTYTFPNDVETDGDLENDIVMIDNGAAGSGPGIDGLDYVVNIDPNAGTIDLSQSLTAIALLGDGTLTINGNGATIDGQNLYAGLADVGGGAITLNDLDIVNTSGGDANLAGGLVVGAVYQDSGSPVIGEHVTLNNVHFANDAANDSSNTGLADDVTVDAGAVLTVTGNSSFGASNSATPSPAGAVYVAAGGTIDFVTTTDDAPFIAGPLAGSGLVEVEGSGSLTVDDVEPRLGSVQSFGGAFDVEAGATLDLNYDPTDTYGSINVSGTVVFNTSAAAQAIQPAASFSGYNLTLLPTDVVRIDYQLADANGDTGSLLIPVPNYSLATFVSYFNAEAQGILTASIDAANPAQIDFSRGATPYSYISVYDEAGSPLQEMGVGYYFSDGYNDGSDGSVIASGAQSQIFQDGDVIAVNGTAITLGPSSGYATLGDLLQYLATPDVDGPNGIAPGLAVSVDAYGDLSLTSPNEFTLTDISGTPVEEMGLSQGLYGSPSYDGDITGSGDVVFNHSIATNGTAAWTGDTIVNGGTLTFTGDTSRLTGTIEIAPQYYTYGPATLEFDEASDDVFSGSITGNGSVVITGPGTLTLAGSIDVDPFGGAPIVLEGGTANIVSAAAANEQIQFAANAWSTLKIGQGVTLAGGISGFATGDRIDLAGFDASTTELEVGADGTTLMASDASGNATSIATDTSFAGMLVSITNDGIGGAMLTAVAQDYSIGGFTPNSQLDLPEIAYDPNGSANLLPGDVLQIVSGGNSYDVVLAQGENWNYFHTSSDAFGTTAITSDDTPCYCCGTRVLTPHGDVAVEDLSIGDILVTLAGEHRPLRWIGRRSYAGRFAMGNRTILPILIRAGALADNVPHRDLYVSPLHALFLDGILIPAFALVNDVSIRQLEEVESIEYFHLELETHDVILAEGAPAESFLDDDSRAMFHNVAEFNALYPDAPRHAGRYCAPLLDHGQVVEDVRRRLQSRTTAPGAPTAVQGFIDHVDAHGVSGWAFDAAHSDDKVRLRVLDNGVEVAEIVAERYRGDLAAAGIGDGRHGFEWRVPGGLSPLLQHAIRVEAVAGGQALPHSNAAADAAA